MNQDKTIKIKSLIKDLIIANADHLTNQIYIIMKHHFTKEDFQDEKNYLQKTKIKQLKDELQQDNKKIKQLKDELQQDNKKIKQLKDELQQDNKKTKQLKDELQQDNKKTKIKQLKEVKIIYVYKTKKEISCLDKLCIREEINKVFNFCKTTSLRSHHTKSMKYIKQLMKQYSIKLSFNEYKQELVKIVNMCKELCKLKQYTITRQNILIQRMMTTVDVRLIRYSNYFEINVEQTDIDYFQTMIQTYLKLQNYYHFHSIIIYSTSIIGLLPLQHILYIILPYSNIICKNKKFFYMLEYIKDKERKWKQDSYLTQFTLEFVNHVITEGINLFRTIYKDIFEDNDYREDYKSKNAATDSDLQQILENIVYLNNVSQVNQLIQNYVKKNCNYKPLDFKDHFDFETNLKKNYLFSENQFCLIELSNKLFDNIEGKNIFKL